jgi:rare lipoprotein A
VAEPAPAVSTYHYAANIIGGIPRPDTGKHYRLQVGAYRIPRNAVEAFDRLKDVGLNPAYEINGDIYRVVLAWLDPKDIPAIAEKLYYAGFPEAVIREER